MTTATACSRDDYNYCQQQQQGSWWHGWGAFAFVGALVVAVAALQLLLAQALWQ